MVEFAYNNANNESINHMFFELNYSYQPYVSILNKTYPYLITCLANKLTKKLSTGYLFASKTFSTFKSFINKPIQACKAL